MTGRETPRAGVLGGSFDPVHFGHLTIAEAVAAAFELPRVLLVPCAVPPHKSGERLAAAEHRIRMLELAVEGRERLEVSTIEIERGGTSFTIDTLRRLRDDPDRPVRPLFVMGWDSLVEIETWHEHRALVAEFDIAAVVRPEERGEPRRPDPPSWVLDRLVDVEASTGGGRALLEAAEDPRTFRVAIEPIPISSSRIRSRTARGALLDGLVPTAVARYIQRERLYSQEDPR